jgi:type IV pilus assembly protein PilC
MPEYKYQCKNKGGELVAGVIRASSLEEAGMLVRNTIGGFLLDLAPSGSDSQMNIIARMRQVKVEFGPGLKDVLTFTTQLAVMVKAGINIRQAIDGIAKQVENHKFHGILMQIRQDVDAGQPFSTAIAKYPKVFSPLYINMIRASELSGSLGQMLDRIVLYLNDQVETRSMVRGAMIYPSIIAFMAISTTVFLLTFVLPKFTVMFEGKEALLPLPTKFLIQLSAFMRNQWYFIVAGIVGLIVSLVYFVRTPTGRVYWDSLMLRLPLVKKMIRALCITRGLHTMGELVNAGVPMLETLTITAEVSGNTFFKRLWQTVHNSVKEGNKIASGLTKQTYLPPNVVQMISAGEESGRLGEVMRDVAEFYGKELRATIKSVTSMIEPLMIVMMGGVVGFIAMSIILPIFKMSSLLK